MTTIAPLSTKKYVRFDSEAKACVYAEVRGTVTLEIDVEKIFRILGGKALCNRTGISREIDGLVVAKVSHRTQSEISISEEAK